MKKIFFGAGYWGRCAYELCKSFGIVPDYFVDNCKKLWGREYCGVRILSLEETCKLENIEVLITCKNVKEITKQLYEMGMADENIWEGCNNWSILSYVCHLHVKELELEHIATFSSTEKIFFDLYGGLVLGGVESWSFQMMEKLQREGHEVICLTNDQNKHILNPKEFNTIELQYKDVTSEKDKIQKCINAICSHLPCTIVCNFPFHTLFAACIAKKLCPDNIHVIAVVHSDDQIYYENYVNLKEYIDLCLVISSRIQLKLIHQGFPNKRINVLQWKVPVKEQLVHIYSKHGEAVKIGYAGRLVVVPKRMDLLLQVAKRLEEMGCNYQLEIAGIGTYESEMKEQIRLLKLQYRISMLGYLDRQQIAEFWNRQDIMVSCSDWEGHSISQVEAMAAGAVPIITDTSGARDDVQDGISGYVVGVGQIEEMVDKIIFLHDHREILERMGRCAYKTIKNRLAQTEFLEQYINMNRF